MPQSYRSRFLSIQAANERRMAQLFRDLAQAIAGDVTRRADADGNVPRTATFDLQRLAGERIQRIYLGMSHSGQLAPFEIGAGGKLIPLSPYMTALWGAITAAVRIPIEQNAAILAKRLPADVLAVMRLGTEDPFKAAGAQVAEVEVFRPNPLAQYEAPHTWVDPNGYRLSDRIWNTAAAERQRLNAYLDDAIKQGKGALTMSRELVQFLDPSRSGLKTSKPYGSKVSFDAMRLARTEITRAHGQAHVVAGAMNPFVAGDKWNLSPRHPRPDVCDIYARGGPNGDGVYPTGTLPGYPAHPSCLCNLTYALISDPDAIIEELRRDIRRERAQLVDKIGPLAVDDFDRLLLGETISETTLTARRAERQRQRGSGASSPEEAQRRRQALEDLRTRLTFTSTENLVDELADLQRRIAAAGKETELHRQLTEERRIYNEVQRERRKLEQEERRQEAERLRAERQAATRAATTVLARQPVQRDLLEILDQEFAGAAIQPDGADFRRFRDRVAALVVNESKLSVTGTFHGMDTDVQFKGFRLGNQEIYWENRATIEFFVRDVFAAKQQGVDLPRTLTASTKRVFFTSQYNRNDTYWRQKYKNFTNSLATGGDSDIVVYHDGVLDLASYAHEMGHNLAASLYGTTAPRASSLYSAAMIGEEPVSEYAKNSASEDFAESISQYVMNGSYMKLVAPQRYAVIDQIIRTGSE